MVHPATLQTKGFIHLLILPSTSCPAQQHLTETGLSNNYFPLYFAPAQLYSRPIGFSITAAGYDPLFTFPVIFMFAF